MIVNLFIFLTFIHFVRVLFKPSKSDYVGNVSLEIYESIENCEILNKHQGY